MLRHKQWDAGQMHAGTCMAWPCFFYEMHQLQNALSKEQSACSTTGYQPTAPTVGNLWNPIPLNHQGPSTVLLHEQPQQSVANYTLFPKPPQYTTSGTCNPLCIPNWSQHMYKPPVVQTSGSTPQPNDCAITAAAAWPSFLPRSLQSDPAAYRGVWCHVLQLASSQAPAAVSGGHRLETCSNGSSSSSRIEDHP